MAVTRIEYNARNDILKKAAPTAEILSSILGVIMQEFDPTVKATMTAPSLINKGGLLSDSRETGDTVEAPEEKEPEVATYVRPNGEIYYTRKWGVHQDVEVLRKAREASHYALLYGAPGCGKTALVEAAFENVYTVLGTGDTEVADFIGGYTQTPTGAFVWTDGPLLKAAEEGAPLLIDEIGLVDPKVLAVVYAFMDGRREYSVTANPERGTVKAKDGFFIVAATNPNAPGVRLSEALLSRFLIHVEMVTDYSLAKKLGAPVDIIAVSVTLQRKVKAGELSWAPQMRELIAYRDIAKVFGRDFAISNLIAASPEIDRDSVLDYFKRSITGNYSAATI